MEAEGETDGGGESQYGMSITVPIPAADNDLYRYEATDGVLRILADNPYEEFTIRELSRFVGYSHPAISNAVGVLESNALVTVSAEGNRKHVSIDRNRLTKPDDPVLRIPQSEFHAPVRTALDRLQDELADVVGILVFGSVARGEADRQSDIDLWVLVQSDRATNQRRANEIGTDLTETRFAGDRYEFQILVESARSALNVSDRLTDVLASSITLYETETLRRFKREVRSDAE
ncbi:DNA polymerase subunit beta [Salinadaptatus halalkaliphilus]|uniref:DNA polymerase subunit beta n=1 Tax=Salinadaptatus halalkaliphilus TaxID=2419781 RepID=A0A4S3TJ59_9EURY|nr:nucleotidyltransferase domain-containing protein [Salinadaptatus halalkaliphilus]THE63253.1 DNA polymerase subunit beta [Salinadaptatus halalkaliphilus]